MLLSVCITVYNQINIVKANLDQLHNYDGNDIEVIVSDDNSTEDISELVASYNDERIKYFSTGENIGHDRNILFSLGKANGDFAIVLRSRDQIIVETLRKIIELISKNNECSYMLFSALDQDGIPDVLLSDKLYASGNYAIDAHFKLMVHPSGNVYNMCYLSKQELLSFDRFLVENFNDKFAFIVHDLIRIMLAVKGSFCTYSYYGWIYDITKITTKEAVNACNDGKSVYSPELNYRRLDAEIKYICSNEIFKCYRSLIVRKILLRYFKAIVYDFSITNKDKVIQKHYKFSQEPFSMFAESRSFLQHAYALLDNFSVTGKKLIKILLSLYAFKVLFYYGIRDKIMHCVLSKNMILRLNKLINRV